MRGRGLKRFYVCQPGPLARVAPHAGAWIETHQADFIVGHGDVAPHAGAWIETPRVCIWPRARAVAPHAGAWIETS